MRKYSSNLAFVDILFNLLTGITSLFIIAFLMINPIAKTGEVDPPVMMMVEVRWGDELHYDVDTWIKTPRGTISYRNKENGFASLERDDLGGANDFVEINGERVIIPLNYEVVNFRALPDGEYTINVHMFSHHLRYGPSEVEITVSTLGPYRLVYSGKVTFTVPRQQITVVSFIVEDGKISDINTTIQRDLRGTFLGTTP